MFTLFMYLIIAPLFIFGPVVLAIKAIPADVQETVDCLFCGAPHNPLGECKECGSA